jgi:hypothetical protein
MFGVTTSMEEIELNSKYIKYGAWAVGLFGVYRLLFAQVDSNGNSAFAQLNSGTQVKDIVSEQNTSYWLISLALVAVGIYFGFFHKK